MNDELVKNCELEQKATLFLFGERRQVVWLTEEGRRAGGTHHRARLTDEQVEEIRCLHETGMVGYRSLAKQYGVSRSCIQRICNYETRNVPLTKVRVVRVQRKAKAEKDINK